VRHTRGAITRYSLWSQGRLLGYTALDFHPSFPTARLGWFLPTAEGERLMPVLTNLGSFHEAIPREMADTVPVGGTMREKQRHALACQPLQDKLTRDAATALQALDLELRDESGRTIPTQDLAILDTEDLLEPDDGSEIDDGWDPETESIENEMDEFDAALAELGMLDESPSHELSLAEFEGPADELDEPQLPRYQIMVELINAADVPVPVRWLHDPDIKEMRDEIGHGADPDEPGSPT
jgi:hypothetical protein